MIYYKRLLGIGIRIVNKTGVVKNNTSKVALLLRSVTFHEHKNTDISVMKMYEDL